MSALSFKSGPLAGQRIALDALANPTTIGRGVSSSLVIPDGVISSRHAALHGEGGEWRIEDLGSSNGTLVNGKLVQSAVLHDGDEVTLGESIFVLETAGEADAQPQELTSGVVPPGVASAAVAEPTVSLPPAPSRSRGGGAGALDLTEDDVEIIRDLNAAYQRMTAQLGRVIIGQGNVIEQVLISILCRGHALLVGVPGLAKTLLVSTLSQVLDLSFKRIQFTPDLMPSDITGTTVLEEDHTTGRRMFRFVKGPLFSNMVLADEINRTPPKTQAALLEAMQEHIVTVGETSYDLPAPFFVLATQNPIEQEGTYPLPEAQLDRFMFNIIVKYPTAPEECRIIKQVTGTYKADLEVALKADELLRLQQVVRRVPVADHVVEFAANLARATRPNEPEAPALIKEMVSWGAGPRAGIYLIMAAKANAILHGRYHATTQDVIATALPVLRHRVLTTFNAEASGITSDEVIQRLIEQMNKGPEIDV